MRFPALALVACLLLAGCVQPKDRRPGFRLSGEVVPGAVSDWSFSDDHREIFVETRTPYWIPHSVTIVCASLDGRLYIGARHPAEKRWVGHVARDPRVRIKIGQEIYLQRLEPVEDPAEREEVYRAYARKYGWTLAPESERPAFLTFRVLDRSPV